MVFARGLITEEPELKTPNEPANKGGGRDQEARQGPVLEAPTFRDPTRALSWGMRSSPGLMSKKPELKVPVRGAPDV